MLQRLVTMLFVLPFVTGKLSNTEGKGEKWSRSEKVDANGTNACDKL